MNPNSRTILEFLAQSHPYLWEILHPHVPKISEGTRQIMTSMVIKSISREIKDADIAEELRRVGESLFEAGAKSMNYDDDDWCGTMWPRHFKFRVPPPPDPWYYFGPSPEPWRQFFSFDSIMLNPQPLPPKDRNFYGAMLTALSQAVSIESAAEELRNIGSALMDASVKAN